MRKPAVYLATAAAFFLIGVALIIFVAFKPKTADQVEELLLLCASMASWIAAIVALWLGARR